MSIVKDLNELAVAEPAASTDDTTPSVESIVVETDILISPLPFC